MTIYEHGVEETTLGSIRVALLNVTEYAQLHSHRMPGWGDLPSEAFEQRHEIKEGGREEDLLAGEDGNEGAMQTVTVEDKTSDVVVWGVHGQDTRSSWSCGAVTADTLTWLAEQGDVQNAVSNDQQG